MAIETNETNEPCGIEGANECALRLLTADLLNLAKTVAHLIEQDGAKESFIKASQEHQIQIGLAYVDEAGRRITRLQNLFLTNPEFKKMFLRQVFEICKLGEKNV